MINFFKYPSQIGFHRTIELIKTATVFLLLGLVLIKVAEYFNLNQDAIYVFYIYWQVVYKSMMVVALIRVLHHAVEIFVRRKNKVTINELGCVLKEVVLTKWKFKKVLSLHLDGKVGMEKAKQKSSSEATRYMIKEFIEMIETLQANPDIYDYEVVRGTSSKIKPSLLKRAGIEAKQYKSLIVNAEGLFVNLWCYNKKEKGWLKRAFRDCRKVYTFELTRDEFRRLDLNKFKRLYKN